MSVLPQSLLSSGVVERYSFELAERLARLAQAHPQAVATAAALAGEAMLAGHACVEMTRAVAQVRQSWRLDMPDAVAWQAQLLESGVAGPAGQYAPLVIDAAGRLFLHRYWRYEHDVADALLARAVDSPEPVDPRWLAASLDRWVGRAGVDAGTDEQRVAVALAMLQRLAVITGGPGTGKTTTAVRILTLLAQLPASRPLRVALAAPTGKAAGRLEQAIRDAKARLGLDGSLAAAIPDRATTIHRLIGARGRMPVARVGAQPTLPIDVLLVDEVSMVDLALMARLIAVLPAHARLILLGDKDQLASVEAGAVLASLTAPWSGYSAQMAERLREITGVALDAASDPKRLADCVAVLRHGRRFATGGAVGALAQATLAGDEAAVALALDNAEVRVGSSPESLTDIVDDGFGAFTDAIDRGAEPGAVFATLDRFRVLCVHRGGPHGITALNRWIEARLRRALVSDRAEGEWFAGRVVMITTNDYNLRLFNGEIGVALRDREADGELRVFFADTAGSFRSFAPARLPAREGGYALTVHKSQGSEFDRIVLALPREASPIVTRELLYTAVTRARERVCVWGDAALYAQGVRVKQMRESGLGDLLWER